MTSKGGSVAEMFVDIRGDITKLKRDINNLQRSTRKETKKIEESFSSTFKRIGRSTAAFFGITAGVTALSRVLSAALDKFRAFDKEMQNVNTIIGVSATRLDSLKTGIKELAKATGSDAKDLAEGMYQATSAGVSAANALEFVGVAAKAAKAGLSSTKTAVDGLTTVINAWHMSSSDAQKVSDIMFQTVKLGKTTFEELSGSMSTVAGLAAASGVSFEEVAGALASLTKQGVPTAQAATQIRAAIIAMNENLGDGWANAMKLTEGMEQMKMIAGNSQVALKEMVGRVEGVNAILGLTGQNAKMAASDLEAMGNAGGASLKAFAEQSRSLDFTINKLGSTFDTFLLSAAEALEPVMRGAIFAMQKFADVLSPVEDALTQERIALQLTARQALDYKEGTDERRQAIAELKGQFPAYLSYLDEEKSTNDDIKKAMEDINRLYTEKAKKIALEKAMTKVQEEQAEAFAELANEQYQVQKIYEAMHGVGSSIGKDWGEMTDEVNDFVAEVSGFGPLAKLVQALGVASYDVTGKQEDFNRVTEEATRQMDFYKKKLDETNLALKEMGVYGQAAKKEIDSPFATTTSTDTTAKKVKIKVKPIRADIGEDPLEEVSGLSEEEVKKKMGRISLTAEEGGYNIGTAAIEGLAASGIGAIWSTLSEGLRKETGIIQQMVVGMVDAVIAELNRILALKLLTKLAQGPLSFLNFQHGGSIIGSAEGPKKMAGGGSFDVPFGFSNDKYPIMVESGERIDVATRTKSSMQESMLQGLTDRVEALNANLINQGSVKAQDVNINVQGKIKGNDIRLTYDKNDRLAQRVR